MQKLAVNTVSQWVKVISNLQHCFPVKGFFLIPIWSLVALKKVDGLILGADYAYIHVTFGPFWAFVRLWIE